MDNSDHATENEYRRKLITKDSADETSREIDSEDKMMQAE